MKDGRRDGSLVVQGNMLPGMPVGGGSRGQAQLTEAQRTRIIEGAFRIAEDVGAVVNGLVEIHRIREQSEGEVNRIEAQTRAVVVQTQAELEKLRAGGANTVRRGDVAVRIIQQVRELLEAVPDLEAPSRRALIDGLPLIISATLKGE